MIDAGFGHWLAGFIDGEGCFAIHRANLRGGRHSMGCKLIVKLRDDDRSVLDMIARTTGIGRVNLKPAGGDGRTCQAQAAWQVQSRPDCLALVQLLDRYPLRAKKARDYLIWREAVLTWTQAYSGNGAGARNVAVWRHMGALQASLRDVRLYREVAA